MVCVDFPLVMTPLESGKIGQQGSDTKLSLFQGADISALIGQYIHVINKAKNRSSRWKESKLGKYIPWWRNLCQNWDTFYTLREDVEYWKTFPATNTETYQF